MTRNTFLQNAVLESLRTGHAYNQAPTAIVGLARDLAGALEEAEPEVFGSPRTDQLLDFAEDLLTQVAASVPAQKAGAPTPVASNPAETCTTCGRPGHGAEAHAHENPPPKE